MAADSNAFEIVIVEPGSAPKRLPLDRLPYTIGRANDNLAMLADPEVSNHHGQIVATAGGISYRDLNSLNGSRLNGAPIEKGATVPVQIGDRVQVGKTQILIVANEPAPVINREETGPSPTVTFSTSGAPTTRPVGIQILVRSSGRPDIPLTFNELPVTIGRSRTNALVLDDAEVSSNHAQLIPLGDGVGYLDLGSLNGSRHNGAPVPGSSAVALAPGDRIGLGKMEIVVERIGDPAQHRTTPAPAEPIPPTAPPPAGLDLGKRPEPARPSDTLGNLFSPPQPAGPLDDLPEVGPPSVAAGPVVPPAGQPLPATAPPLGPPPATPVPSYPTTDPFASAVPPANVAPAVGASVGASSGAPRSGGSRRGLVVGGIVGLVVLCCFCTAIGIGAAFWTGSIPNIPRPSGQLPAGDSAPALLIQSDQPGMIGLLLKV